MTIFRIENTIKSKILVTKRNDETKIKAKILVIKFLANTKCKISVTKPNDRTFNKNITIKQKYYLLNSLRMQ